MTTWARIAAVTALAVAASACGGEEKPRQGPEQPPGRYVALGDSYTSAPATGDAVGSPPGCDRSANNYPRLVAAKLDPAEFVDVSCSGATTEHLVSPQRTQDGTNPPQLNAVTAGTTLVTIGIGGNDVGLIGLAARCRTRDPAASPCRDQLTASGRDELRNRLDRAAAAVGGALRQVTARAPDARVIVVGYPTILPADPDACWPELPYSPQDVAYLRQGLERFNTILAEQARRHGAEFADTAAPTRGHGMCAPPEDRWVEGPEPVTGAAPLHPTARGEEAMAAAVLQLAGTTR
ncbi:SGNH/GDSL hydrolase family protein [Prauserella muralis]|uniref:GDSL family lipase n=1 Tax=Prauserella muralis TaxID=588067 RepID=A0A2V4BA66_9PSEU|nr:SGNH/GDSL hydrolase family protein [Prauserella muralis]PXY32150.1 GDSL family lipase [Prauserella muralis]TWE24196.1 GDSL-like lipase/acylhydrolase family protein [Prauserella muralis]